MSDIQGNDSLERNDFGDVTVLRVKVAMLYSDQTTDALFQQAYALVEDGGRSRLVLNLDGVVFLASAAIGRLVTLMHKVRTAGGRLVLCKVTRTIEETLRIAHLTDILLLYGDEQEAVRSFH